MSEIQQRTATAHPSVVPSSAAPPAPEAPPPAKTSACSAVAASATPTAAWPAVPLTTAAIASLLASSCCLLPLALASVGLTGAWLGHLRVLQPYSPILIGIAITALVLAANSLFQRQSAAPSSIHARRLFTARATPSCPPTSARTRASYKAAFWLIAALTLIVLVTPAIAPWFY
jgi:mercuric ion transport protein